MSLNKPKFCVAYSILVLLQPRDGLNLVFLIQLNVWLHCSHLQNRLREFYWHQWAHHDQKNNRYAFVLNRDKMIIDSGVSRYTD